MAHRDGIPVLVDAAQSVPHMPVDVQKTDCDFLAFSAHKMLGPTGVGILYVKREILEEMPPFIGGGDMIKEVHKQNTVYNDLPYRFEGGTPNIAGVIGFGAALDYLNRIGMNRVRDHEIDITKYAMSALANIKDVILYGPLDANDRGGVISFNIADIHPHDLATIMNERGVAIRSGHHCAQVLMERLDVPATSRASFYIYNTKEEVDIFVDALHNARRIFKSMSDDIYREIILDHYRNPRNKGRLPNPDVSIHDSNPLCGDEIDMHLKVEEDKIKDIKFEGRGCAISQASASMLTEMVLNKPLKHVKDLVKEDILENIGLTNLGPARIKCALLSLKVLKMSMVKYYADRDPESASKYKTNLGRIETVSSNQRTW